MPLTALLLALAGAVIGSFLALVSLRLPADRDVVKARSRCDGCGRALGPIDLVPVFSWLILRGRCRTCGSRIPRRYPLIEAGGALIGTWAGLASGTPVEAALTALLGWQLLLIAVVDAEHFWLPDVLTAPLALSGVLAAALLPEPGLRDALIGAVAGFVMLWVVRAIYARLRGREGLGGGDPLLFGAIGAWVGWIGLPSVLLWATAAGLALAGALLVTRRRLTGDERLPFGVCLAAGAWLTWLLGPIGL